MKYSVNLLLRVPPGKIGIGLRKSDFGQHAHHMRPRKSLGEENTSGYCRLISPMIHSQKEKGLVCGLSTRKMRTP